MRSLILVVATLRPEWPHVSQDNDGKVYSYRTAPYRDFGNWHASDEDIAFEGDFLLADDHRVAVLEFKETFVSPDPSPWQTREAFGMPPRTTHVWLCYRGEVVSAWWGPGNRCFTANATGGLVFKRDDITYVAIIEAPALPEVGS